MQTTLSNKVSCSGVGLHSGAPVHMAIYPAPAHTGIVFRRLDVPAEQAFIPARYDLVNETRLGTTVKNRFGVGVATIEHLMAAFWGVGLDNAIVELDGPEVPIMDGSSEPFLFMLECARVIKLSEARKALRILKKVEVRDGDSLASVEPMGFDDEGCTLDIDIQFSHQAIGRQSAFYDFREQGFKQTLSRARTFGFEQEVNALRNMGLALGGSLENAVVVGKDGVLNEEGLRYNDEFVRHKALDCLGDLFLAGHRIDGHFTFVRPGHAINNKLLRAVFADPSAYMITQRGKAPVAMPFVASQVAAYA
ncbi:MAG: UDP-3-O-[3-hydroxymyristoyl] N-acetylglucosamine deacetylase [Proteobacteria bacterium]|nr:UDP-3-O-[3-hydroxymyristoyl] N-acetylglucosamine deacetylase [Pseudomonadota bacterium]